MELHCPSCGSFALINIGQIPSSIHFAGRVLTQTLTGGSLYKCNSCNLYFRWPRLSKEELDRLYKEGSLDNWQYDPKNRKDWQITSAWLKAKLGSGSILDVGCFTGGFLKYLGNCWQRYGIEIYEAAAQYAEKAGINIIAKDFGKIDQLLMQFDAVVAYDIVEHVEDPRFLLKQMSQVTRSGGFIIISTGNTDCPSWRFMGSRYWYCAIWEHVSFINPSWCYNSAKSVNLTLEHIEKFSHAGKKRNFLGIIYDLAKNILYKVSPHIVSKLRAVRICLGKGRKNTKIIERPPGWASAKDHLIVIFRKP